MTAGSDDDSKISAVVSVTNNNNSNNKGDATSLSEYLNRSLHHVWSSCGDGEDQPYSVQSRVQAAEVLERHLLKKRQQQQEEEQENPHEEEEAVCEEVDAYITMSGPCQGHLPALDWNHNFRKAYTMLMWIRPRLMTSSAVCEKDNFNDDNQDPQQEHQQERVIYRLSTSASDEEAAGVCVACSEWKVVAPTIPNLDSVNNNEASSSGGRRRRRRRQLQTLLTAYSLPTTITEARMQGSGTYSAFVETRLTLEEDMWHLVGFCHEHPYLKHPLWTLTVNGAVQGHGSLDYPVVAGSTDTQGISAQDVFGLNRNIKSEVSVSMDYNLLLSNVVRSGAILPPAEAGTDAGVSRVGLSLDISSFSLYPVAVSPNLQAVAAESGPAAALQKLGRILPTLPPVANWSKGSSFEGPKVGIPLVVHSAALELQQTAGKCIFAISALSARVLGVLGGTNIDPQQPQQRILCALELQPGSTEATPRVGLIQPAAVVHIPEEEMPVFYLTGHVKVHHALSEFLLKQDNDDVINFDSTDNMTNNLSIALQEQGLLNSTVMPFFLSLTPPGHLYGLQQQLYERSVQQLFALYHRRDDDSSENGGATLASALIKLLTAAIRVGGGRVHEDVLQSGTLHCLACAMRLSLDRASAAGMFEKDESSRPRDWKELLKRCQKLDAISSGSNNDDTTSPTAIPTDVVLASVDLIDACCGSAAINMESLSPLEQVRRTSDLALTAIFGFSLDLDLWGCCCGFGGGASADCNSVYFAPCQIFQCVAQRYGGSCAMYGYILRSQMSVQYFLDIIRLHFSNSSITSPSKCSYMEQTAVHLSRMLQSMLLSSLSNKRSIAQSEHDCQACCSALADCPLGSFAVHVILNAIMSCLTWCEILPVEAVTSTGLQQQIEGDSAFNQDEEMKMQVARRLGRNLLSSQFHDVIAPMLLSRMAFSGERIAQVAQQQKTEPSLNFSSGMTWQHHWQLSLLLFSWVSSIAGTEGLVAAKSTGSLLLASALAGSLPQEALESASKVLITALFLPPPGMALMIGSLLPSSVREWSYTDLLSDRLQIMIPLLPGMVVSLVTQQQKPSFQVSLQCCQVLSEVLTAVGGAFHRVYGGTIHSTEGTRRQLMNNRDKTSEHIKAAKQYVPQLLTVSMVLETYIQSMSSGQSGSNNNNNKKTKQPRSILVFKPPASSPRQHEATRQRLRSDSCSSASNVASQQWVEVQTASSIASESLLDEVVVDLPSKIVITNTDENLTEEHQHDGDLQQTSSVQIQGLPLQNMLNSCQKSVINTASGLISNAMNLGGAGASLSIWQAVPKAMNEATAHLSTAAEQVIGTDAVCDNVKKSSSSIDIPATAGLSVLCRLVATVLSKALKHCSYWELWSYELSGACAKLMLLVEEKELLKIPAQNTPNDDVLRIYSSDQILLVSTLVDVMAAGRDATGWCQLPLPTMNLSDNNKSPTATKSPSDASKLLLPVLQPAFRVLIGTVEHIDSETIVQFSVSKSTADEKCGQTKESLLARLLFELDSTLTAAIVGLSFSSARDMALHAAATLRRAAARHDANKDTVAADRCRHLLCKVVEELRVRYQGERRLRETALFDAYEDKSVNAQEHNAARQAAADTQAVERLILGDDVWEAGQQKRLSSETIIFSNDVNSDSKSESQPLVPKSPTQRVSDDFIIFHEPKTRNKDGDYKMGYAKYEGLGAALEKCKPSNDDIKIDSDSSCAESSSCAQGETEDVRSARHVLNILAPFFDAWDATGAEDVADSELVKLFDISMVVDDDDKTKIEKQQSIFPAAAMSTFFEIAASEKSRLNDISIQFFPGHRSSRISYTDRFYWARYMEMTTTRFENDDDDIWERGINDGNRDVRSRLPTVPCAPQFRRYIPKYLDNNADLSTEANIETASDGRVEDNKTKERDEPLHDQKMDADAFTKTLLETTNLEIVDITKKELNLDEDDGIPDDDQPLHSNEEELNERVFDEDQSPTIEGENDDAKDKNDASFEESFTAAETTIDNSLASLPAADRAETETESTTVTSTMSSQIHHHRYHNIASSAFSTPPDNASSSLNLMHSAASNQIELHMNKCLHVKAEGSRACTMLLTSTHVILEYDCRNESSTDTTPDGFYEGEKLAIQEETERQRMIQDLGGCSHTGDSRDSQNETMYQRAVEQRQLKTAALRPKSIRWNLSEASHILLRRYRLRDSSIELFFLPSGGTSFGGYGLFSPAASLFLDFGPGYEGVARRDEAAVAIMKRSPPQTLKQWPDRSAQFLHDVLSKLTIGWAEGRISNFDYLLHLNTLSGRSYNDICQYPVFPWVLADYSSEQVPDLTDRRNFRDLTKPVGALNPERLDGFKERFRDFSDPSIPPFMYGSHYSTSAGVVLHFLVRLHPYAGLHRQLQGGHFDVADRLFSSVPRTWSMCTGSSAAEVKELTPEWYCNPEFLKNNNKFKLGTSQDGELIDDVILPPWADNSPEKFVEVMRAALESEICSSMLPGWIDLIFGHKQKGPAAIEANNVFFYLTYYGSVDVAGIENEELREATELQIAHFGQCPMQLFRREHIPRFPVRLNALSFYQVLSLYHPRVRQLVTTSKTDDKTNGESEASGSRTAVCTVAKSFGEPPYLPFLSAPLSHWVHLSAPPPGPHSPLVAVRLAGTDRILAIDAKGIFHCFRWAWRIEENQFDNNDNVDNARSGSKEKSHLDFGCFIAQRELPRFRSVPRLMHTPTLSGDIPAVAISKTLFAGRAVLLVLSDGDGRGALGMQLVDPAKGQVRGEVVIPAVHSGRVTCIAMDPIGTAAGQGGVGGELALVASADGNATLWRFMSSRYLPLRPRVRIQGSHGGTKIYAAALCSSIHVGATVSKRNCCLFNIGNGALIRSFQPPAHALGFMNPDTSDVDFANDPTTTCFADTPALAVSVQGYVVAVCETVIPLAGVNGSRTVVTLNLFTSEGVNLGCKPLESWRGLPRKMYCTPDGTAVIVCCGRGVTIHRLSTCQPFEFLDEWQVTEDAEPTMSKPSNMYAMSEEMAKSTGASFDLPGAWDVDFGPSLNRPVIAAAACTSGVMRLHALQGISAWSERHKKSNISQTVGSALAKPARRLNQAVKEGWGLGRQLAGMGRDIRNEVSSDVKERGVGGFLGQVVFRKNKKP